MSNIDLTALSVAELQALQGGIDGAIEAKKNEELLVLRDQIDELVDNSPFTLEEILNARKAKKPVAPKYQNPDDASQTWTGRGRKPKWVEAHLEQGGSLDAIAI